MKSSYFCDADVIIDPSSEVSHGACLLSGVVVGKFVKIGCNSTIYPGIMLHDHCQVEPGAVVTRDVPRRSIVAGNPAKIVGYTSSSVASSSRMIEIGADRSIEGSKYLLANGTQIIDLPTFSDLRGTLCAAEFPKDLPFIPRRCFLIYDVPNSELRGEHSHKLCHQLLICVHGTGHAIVDDGHECVELVLNSKNRALYMPPMTWGVQYKYSEDAILLVLASHAYDPEDYIRDYSEYLGALSQS
jgi:UDP-2-acetamido-3-amino-2,3-dideoxy-glucuronate N-acetyltransferase